jgi:hypothetical protein
MSFSIKEVLPHVYHLDFDRQYDLAMHFLRFQEYYESPKFYRRFFTLVEYMDWYAKGIGQGAFTYPRDWAGFNVPSRCLLPFLEDPGKACPDLNEYDQLMLGLIEAVVVREEGHPFYFIGTFGGGNVNKDGGKDAVEEHEIAHALYTVNAKYRKKVKNLLKKMNQNQLAGAKETLTEMGYHRSTQLDEVHAYCATGLCKALEGVVSNKQMRPFQKLFQEYKKLCAK